jgi:hypothetical protein
MKRKHSTAAQNAASAKRTAKKERLEALETIN